MNEGAFEGDRPTIALPRPPGRIRIGSVAVDAVSSAGAFAAIEALAVAGRGGSVFTPNVDHFVQAELNPEFRSAYQGADLVVADGQWVVWAARLIGTPVPEKISGSDLVLPLARKAAHRRQSLYLLGGRPGSAELAARRLERETGVHICGCEAPLVDLAAPDEALLDRIAAARPTYLLVALGAPKQEIWIHRHARRLRPTVLLGVGATLDFLAGKVRRAPAWVSMAGLEWLFRLALEPRRLARRYLVNDPRFLAILVRTWREQRAARLDAPRLPVEDLDSIPPPRRSDRSPQP